MAKSRKTSYRIQKEVKFEASHVLEGLPEGHKCSNLHGHSYRVIVKMRSDELDSTGMVVDFGILSVIRERFDHKHLNVVLKGINPTAENLARVICETINQVLLRMEAQDEVVVESVTVWETENSMAEFVVEEVND